MQLKQYFQYSIQFKGKWSTAAGIFAGLSLFLRSLYYFAIADLSAVSTVGMIFLCILPLLVSGGYLVFLKCLRYNAPGLYGILGCLMCMIIIMGSFTSGDILRVLVSIIWYLIVGALFLGTTAGVLPDKIFSVMTLLVSIAVRMFTVSLGAASAVLTELSTTAMLISLLCLLVCLRPRSSQTA